MVSDKKSEKDKVQKASTKSNKSSSSCLVVKDTDSIKIKTDESAYQIEHNRQIKKVLNQVFAFGSAECDQFYINNETFETRRPVEIPFFAQTKIRISSIICGSQHTAVLSDQGDIYTWGNADSFALGRPGEDKTPKRVELPHKVDLCTAGDCYTAVANSARGSIFFWGSFVSLTQGKFFQQEHPQEVEYYYIRQHGVKSLCGGANHILVLSGKRAFTWGDSESGALGTFFRSSIEKKRGIAPGAVGIKSVLRVFATPYCSFFITKKRLYACGLNGFNQLGLFNKNEFERETQDLAEALIEKTPQVVPGINPDEICYICGGEGYVIIRNKDGEMFGSGKNDDGQLGDLNANIVMGNFQKISHVPAVNKVLSSAHFNYALNKQKMQYYSWGFGASYVLGNGKEDSLSTCHPVSNERFFKGEPSELALGHSHVVFSTGPLSDVAELTDQLLIEKKSLRHNRASKPGHKKVNY